MPIGEIPFFNKPAMRSISQSPRPLSSPATGIQRRCIPVDHRDEAAAQLGLQVAAAKCITSSVAGTAMSQALRQISAAIPLYRLFSLRLIDARPEIQRAPAV